MSETKQVNALFLSALMTHHSSLLSVVRRHGFDGSQHLLVGEFVGGAGEAGVPAVEQQGNASVGVPSERSEQLTAFGLSERTKVHDRILLADGSDPGARDARKVSSVRDREEISIGRRVVGVPGGLRAENSQKWRGLRKRPVLAPDRSDSQGHQPTLS